MDPDLTRLCAIPGNEDLTTFQVEEIMQISRNSLQRLVSNQLIETKRHEIRGEGKKSRVRIPRAAVVRYLVISSRGDRAVILAAIKAQCPQYLPAVADLMPGAAHLPDNVIPMHGTKAKRTKPTHKPETWHPAQLALFKEDFPNQASA